MDWTYIISVLVSGLICGVGAFITGLRWGAEAGYAEAMKRAQARIDAIETAHGASILRLRKVAAKEVERVWRAMRIYAPADVAVRGDEAVKFWTVTFVAGHLDNASGNQES